jgi:hypothetical protein
MSSDDVMIMSVCGGGDGDASRCEFEMECSSHYDLLVFD